MESKSNGDYDKKTGLDTEDVSFSVIEEYFDDPTSSEGGEPPPESPKGSTTPSEQRTVPDSAYSTAAIHRQAYTKLGSNVSCVEVPVTEKRHSKQASAYTLWVHVQCDCFLVAWFACS